MRIYALISVLVMVSLILSACSSSPPAVPPARTGLPPSYPTVLADFVPEKSRYAPGEIIKTTLTFTNSTSYPVTIDPYPAKIDVLPFTAFDPAVFSSSWGMKSYKLESKEAVSLGKGIGSQINQPH